MRHDCTCGALEPKSILVATMLDSRSRNALVRAHQLSLKFGADLHVIHVLSSGGAAPLVNPTREAVTRWAAREASTHLEPQQVLVRVGNRGANIRAAARELGADLIVTGRASPRSLRSSTIDSLMHPLASALLIADAPRDASEIIAATDLRDPLFPVVAPAASLARALSARVTVVHNLEPVGPVLSFPLELSHAANDMLLELPPELPWAGSGAASPFNEGGAPKSTALAIGSLSRHRDADLIVVGMRQGHGRTLMGLLAGNFGGSILAVPVATTRFGAA